MSKNWEEKFRTEDLQLLRGFRLMDDDFMSKCFEKILSVQSWFSILFLEEMT